MILLGLVTLLIFAVFAVSCVDGVVIGTILLSISIIFFVCGFWTLSIKDNNSYVSFLENIESSLDVDSGDYIIQNPDPKYNKEIYTIFIDGEEYVVRREIVKVFGVIDTLGDGVESIVEK